METKRYIIYSSGRTLPNFDVQQVTINLSNAFDLPQNEVSELFINGATKKIKSLGSKEKADNLCWKLRKLGLDCNITEVVDTANTHKEIEIPPRESVDPPKTNRHSSSYKWFCIIAVILLLITAATFIAYKWLYTKTPDEISKIEAVLLELNKPSLLLHANADLAKKLDTLSNDINLHSEANEAFTNITVLESLSNEYLFKKTDTLSSSLKVRGQNTVAKGTPQPEWLSILSGQYNIATVIEELDKNHILDKLDNELIKFREDTRVVDEVECPIDPAEEKNNTDMFANITNSQIVIGSSQELVANFLSALAKSNNSQSTILQEWQTYRDGSLLALKLYDQAPIDQDFLAESVKTSLLGDAKLNSLGLKVDTSLINRGITVTIDASSNDHALLKEASQTLNKKIVENENTLPSLTQLLSRIDISYDDSLSIVTTLDSAILGEFGSLTTDLFGVMLGGSPISSGAPEEEVIDDNAWNYSQNQTFVSPVSRATNPFNKFSPVYTNKNVSIFIESVGIKPLSPFASKEHIEKAMQLELSAKRSVPKIENIYGWDKSGIVQTFMITEVSNHSNEQLLIDERCNKNDFGKKSNHEPEDSSSMMNDAIVTPKAVRLNSAASIEDIHHVKGWYQIEIPTSVEKTYLSMTDNRTASWSGGSLFLKGVNNSDVSYVVKGDNKSLIAVRALNANGQLLSYSSSLWSDQNYSSTYKGIVASVEVVIAKEWYVDRFKFDLDSIIPKQIEQESAQTNNIQISSFSLSERDKFNSPLNLSALSDKDKSRLKNTLNWSGISLDASNKFEIGRTISKSSHIIFKHDPSQKWNNTLEAGLILPFEKTAIYNPEVVKIEMTVDGQKYDAISPSISANQYNGEYKPDYEENNTGFVHGSYKIELDGDSTPIEKIEGAIVYTLPKALETIQVNLDEADSKSIVSLTALDYGWNEAVTYSLNKEIGELYSAKLFTEDGGEHIADIEIDNTGEKNLSFKSFDKPKNLELYLTKERHTIREPFEFIPEYKPNIE